jgi:hypothetical protein
MPQVSGIGDSGLPEIGMQGRMDHRKIEFVSPFFKKAAVCEALP